jgi:hypothetical protein
MREQDDIPANPLARPDYVRVDIAGLKIQMNGSCEGVVWINGREQVEPACITITLQRGRLPKVEMESHIYPAYGREQR